MSKYYTILFCLIITSMSFGCNKAKQENDSKITIEGHIAGFNQPMMLYNELERNSYKIPVDSLGNFKFENDSLEKGFYTLFFGMNGSQDIFLGGGTKLKLEIDIEKLRNRSKNAIIISGKNTKESQLLYKKKINSEKYIYGSKENKARVYAKNPDEFINYQINLLDKEKELVDEFVKVNPTTDKVFVEHLILNQLIDYHKKVESYEKYRKHIGEVDIPENFNVYFEDQIPQKDFELFKKHAKYKIYLLGKYHMKLSEELAGYERESLEYFKEKVRYLENCGWPEIIIDPMFEGFVISYMRSEDKETRDYLTEIIYKKVKSADALKSFEDYKAKEASYKDGDMAPDLINKDINGNEVSFSDFRGSLVYIDLWATWCMPCMQGMPRFKKLRDAYAGKKIEFVAISLDHDVDKWKKKVSKNKDGLFDGIQLCAGGFKGDIYKYFVLHGIPQYILIGADGRIIKKDAPAPYSKKIVELIDANLKSLEN